MKKPINPENLKYLTLGAGGIGLVLRMVLYHTGMDEKGLLISGHWAGVALWVLTGLLAAVLFFMARPIQGPQRYQDAHPASVPAGLGSALLAVVLLMTTVSEFAEFTSNVSLIVWVLGLCSAVSMGFVAFCRLSGRKPIFLCHGVLCIYFALRMVAQYQFWNSDPQLQDYVFYLSAYVALMLTAYHQAAFDADMGRHSSLWLLSLAAVYLCCLSLKGNRDTLLLLAAGIWAFADLTVLTVKPRRRGRYLKEETRQKEV